MTLYSLLVHSLHLSSLLTSTWHLVCIVDSVHVWCSLAWLTGRHQRAWWSVYRGNWCPRDDGVQILGVLAAPRSSNGLGSIQITCYMYLYTRRTAKKPLALCTTCTQWLAGWRVIVWARKPFVAVCTGLLVAVKGVQQPAQSLSSWLHMLCACCAGKKKFNFKTFSPFQFFIGTLLSCIHSWQWSK